ncbi:MAG: prolyl-tRNA synthetase associated domain-containing protein [Pseudomonadota bacterium]
MQSPPPSPEDFSRAPELPVFAKLDALGVTHNTTSHAPTHTVADSRHVKTDIPGGHTKNLFMKDKKGALVLVSAWAESDLPLNRLHRVLGTQRLSFTKADLLWEALRTTPGSVSAFALLHDEAGVVRFVVDKTLTTFSQVNFHPLRNDMTTTIAFADLAVFADACGHQAELVDFAALAAD